MVEGVVPYQPFALRAHNVGNLMQISREDCDKVREEKKQINKRFQEEMLFDQLATTVIEWHEAMVKFAARSDAASSSYPTILKNIRECNLMLRIANVLSTALSFTENVEDDRHNKYQSGNPICTIARELRNRIQHSWILSQPGGSWTDMWITTPQINEMPANFTKNSVTLSVPWQEVRDAIELEKGQKCAERFDQACKQEFPNLDSLDMVIVINGYLKCLSGVINKRRMAQPLDEFLRTHTVPHPVSWTHVCATRHGVARIARALRLACDTPAFRGASTGCSVRRTQRRPRAHRRGFERPGRRRLAP